MNSAHPHLRALPGCCMQKPVVPALLFHAKPVTGLVRKHISLWPDQGHTSWYSLLKNYSAHNHSWMLSYVNQPASVALLDLRHHYSCYTNMLALINITRKSTLVTWTPDSTSNFCLLTQPLGLDSRKHMHCYTFQEVEQIKAQWSVTLAVGELIGARPMVPMQT